MSTVTVARGDFTRRIRSLSLIGTGPSPLFKLPVELLIEILQFAIHDSKPRILALISKAVSNLVNFILYRTVVLDSLKTVTLFHRTAASKAPALCHVNKLVVTWSPESLVSQYQLQAIVAACGDVRTLVVPSFHVVPECFHSETAFTGLSSLTVQTFEQLDLPTLTRCSVSLTHLRVCEPGDTWCSPSSILSAFGSLPNLAYVQFPRRTNSNEANDKIFADDIRSLLQTLPMLKLVVVIIFSGQPWLSDDAVEESNIWNLITDVQEEDKRVYLSRGEYNEWSGEWVDQSKFCAGTLPVDYWAKFSEFMDD
ncbi:hypothetical protein BDQ17DRAFT_1232700 [Cyathus striatus]|nr:hypothetical protein BDQ17DRAFT_1232700 [Cyathus striatus]